MDRPAREVADEFAKTKIDYPGAGSSRLMLDLEISLVSTLYGGGVDAGHLDEITPFRASSIRGHLRYWWRATRGAEFKSWQELRDREAQIWGDADHPSAVRVRVRTPADWQKWKVALAKYLPRDDRSLNRRYALFPPYNERGVNPQETRFLEGASFTLAMRLRDRQHAPDVEAALWGWLNFGGLGARTRRGAGALYCPEFAGWNPNYVQGNGEGRLWPVLRGGALVWGPRMTWAEAWDSVLRFYREFRQDREGRGPTAWPEPDEIRAIRQQRGSPTQEGFPRGALGMPIVFHFKDRGEPPDQTLSTGNRERRNGPLEPGRMTSPVILKPFAISPEHAHPSLLVLNAPEAHELYLFQKDAETKRVLAGRRDAIAELIRRAKQAWNADPVRI